MGDLRVYASKQALISLAGPHGSGESENGNALCVARTKAHFSEAKKKLIDFGGLSEEEAEAEASRLVPIIIWLTKLPRFQQAVTELAEELISHRKLMGDQAVAVISQAWGK